MAITRDLNQLRMAAHGLCGQHATTPEQRFQVRNNAFDRAQHHLSV